MANSANEIQVKKDFAQIKDIISKAEADVTESTDKGNAAAGTRLREAMQAVKVLAQNVRVCAQAAKNERKASKGK